MFVHSYLYQIAHLGDDDDEPEFSSAMPLEEGDTFFFAPRPLRNLVLVDEMDSLSPILACQVADLGLFIILIVSLGTVVLWYLIFFLSKATVMIKVSFNQNIMMVIMSFLTLM